MKDADKFMQAAKLWAAAAWADGVLTDEEKAGMALLIKIANLSDEQNAEALTWLENKVEAEDIDTTGMDDAQKQEIYKAAAHVTTVDNEVADAEKVFLGRLRKSLGIDEAVATSIHKEVGIE